MLITSYSSQTQCTRIAYWDGGGGGEEVEGGVLQYRHRPGGWMLVKKIPLRKAGTC